MGYREVLTLRLDRHVKQWSHGQALSYSTTGEAEVAAQ
jgi:hypothetical protein